MKKIGASEGRRKEDVSTGYYTEREKKSASAMEPVLHSVA